MDEIWDLIESVSEGFLPALTCSGQLHQFKLYTARTFLEYIPVKINKGGQRLLIYLLVNRLIKVIELYQIQ